MNLLDSVLYTSNAQQFIETFKQHNIDAFTLKILKDEDLKLLGIEEESQRKQILEKAANLQIPAEKKVDICINGPYMQLVLSQISAQLLRHLAALCIALNREDVVVCDVQLLPAARCAEKSLLSLESRLNEFDEKFFKKRKKVRPGRAIISATCSTTVLILISFKLYKYLYCT